MDYPRSLLGLLALPCLLACGDEPAGPGPTAGSSAPPAGSSAPIAGSNPAPAAPCAPDESAPVAPRDAYQQWTKVEVPGASCSDGSPYKFFVNYSQTSNNLLVMFEYGASCWDYATCTACGLSSFCESSLLRGTTNTTGIDDEHMASRTASYALIAPLYGDESAFRGWNKVYIPYCTGDMQMGSKVTEYVSPDGSERLSYKHVGHTNMLAVSSWLNTSFSVVPRLAVVGVSSGGTAALVNYHLLRSRIRGVQCGYLLNDSGPLFSSAGRSGSFQQALRAAYDVEPLLTLIGTDLGADAATALRSDLGRFSDVLARAYPRDRFATALFQGDLNYLFLSYDSVTPGAPYSELAAAWLADLTALRATHDAHPNLAYYMPYFRVDTCSHGLLTPPIRHLDLLLSQQATIWHGTEIAEDGSSMPGCITTLVDTGKPLVSHFEQQHTDGAFGDDGIMDCRAKGTTTAEAVGKGP